MSKKVKPYSIQRSGVNWLMYILAANYKVEVLNSSSGWAHGPFNPEAPADVNIVLSRHPFMWLPSIYRYEQSTESKLFYISSVDRWNILYRSHLENMPDNTVWIRYEDLLQDTEGTLKALEEFGIERKEEPFRIPEKKMGRQMNVTSQDFDANHYIQKSYLYWYEGDLLHMAELLVDWEVANALGYKKIEKSSGN